VFGSSVREEFESQRLAKSYTGCKQFATTSTSTQAAVLPWCYYMEMGTETCYTLGV